MWHAGKKRMWPLEQWLQEVCQPMTHPFQTSNEGFPDEVYLMSKQVITGDIAQILTF